MIDTVNQGDPYTVENVYPTYRHLFNLEAQELMDKPITAKAGAELFGIVTSKAKISEAAEELAKIINTHATRGQITSFLTTLAVIQLSDRGLYNVPAKVEYAIYTGAFFTPEGTAAVNAANYDFHYIDGAMPQKARL